MALYMKQDFSPPVLSRRWVAIKFRPNMLLYTRQHVIDILESGLLFREDSVEVEQEAPSAEEVMASAGCGYGGWLTRGEGVVATAAVAACVALIPITSINRSSLLNLLVYASIPVALRASHRALCRGQLPNLLANMRDYLALARRAAACLKEYAALHTQLGSLTSVIESMHTLLCRQQSSLSVLMSRASSALLGNAPWLRGDVAWHAVAHEGGDGGGGLTQIHHAYLVVQSTLLKHLALAHCLPPPHVQKLYKNQNERIYWIHNTLIKNLNEEVKQNYEALQRMYRLLKNSGNRDDDTKKLGAAINNNWLYSDVHTGVARVCIELKLALNKSNALDMLMDSCALNNEELDADILNKDIDNIIDTITNCLSTIQSSQIRLKKLKGKIDVQPPLSDEKDLIESAAILKIEDQIPETKDEVFYFVKTEEDDAAVQTAGDLTTAPGKKEKEATKIVLNELKRKLGKREDVMRERERQALVKTMPELKNIPEFPRQIKYDEYFERKGFIKKIKRQPKKERLFKNYKINCKLDDKTKKFNMATDKYEREKEIGDYLEANALLNVKSRLITLTSKNKRYYMTRWFKVQSAKKEFDSSGMSEGLSDVEASTANKTVNQAVNVQDLKIKFSKKDLELSASSSDSDTEYYQEQRQLLKDVRRHRVARRKNHPSQKAKPAIDNVDESLKPIEYNFGTGLAMASVLQVNNSKFLNCAQEEVFVGDGEVSNDSGNDEDA